MSNIKIGLDAIGLQDNQHLKSALMNCDDPLKAISDFQDENSILLPTLKPALPLLDLHSVKRLDFHQSIADELRDKLVKRIEMLAASKEPNDLAILEDLLEKSFPVIKYALLKKI
jgi:negative elongation factor B